MQRCRRALLYRKLWNNRPSPSTEIRSTAGSEKRHCSVLLQAALMGRGARGESGAAQGDRGAAITALGDRGAPISSLGVRVDRSPGARGDPGLDPGTVSLKQDGVWIRETNETIEKCDSVIEDEATLKSSVYKLLDKLEMSQLETLLKAIRGGREEVGGCIEVMWDAELDLCPPHLLACHAWRWIRTPPSCLRVKSSTMCTTSLDPQHNASSSQYYRHITRHDRHQKGTSNVQVVCCHPYHWYRVSEKDTPDDRYLHIETRRSEGSLTRSGTTHSHSLSFSSHSILSSSNDCLCLSPCQDSIPHPSHPRAPWCRIAYWEYRQRLGSPYHATQSAVRVAADLREGAGMSLAVIQRADRAVDPATTCTRAKIGRGVAIGWESGGVVWVYNTSEYCVFVGSTALVKRSDTNKVLPTANVKSSLSGDAPESSSSNSLTSFSASPKIPSTHCHSVRKHQSCGTNPTGLDRHSSVSETCQTCYLLPQNSCFDRDLLHEEELNIKPLYSNYNTSTSKLPESDSGPGRGLNSDATPLDVDMNATEVTNNDLRFEEVLNTKPLSLECDTKTTQLSVDPTSINQSAHIYQVKITKLEPGFTIRVFPPLEIPAEEITPDLNSSFVIDSRRTRPLLTRNQGPVNLKSFQISFCKGWGPGYKRPSVTDCPCWLEVMLDNVLR